MEDSHRLGIREGMEVVTADGQRLGRVEEVDVTERGLGPESGILRIRADGEAAHPLTVPLSVVRLVGSDQVVLDATAAEVRAQQWSAEDLG